jgi:hypothetical protein
MKGISELKEALQTKSLTALTKALSELADVLGYQLRPPHTEILGFKGQEEGEGFALHFEAELHLHYSSLGSSQEGLIFAVRFSGDALSDSPALPIHELFYAGVVESFTVYGYGSKWKGRTMMKPPESMKNLEVVAEEISEIDVGRFYQLLLGSR